MSNPISRDQMKSALLSKGFKQSDRDHEFYHFYYNEKKTIVRTKISRGTKHKDYDDNLFMLMKTQLRLSTQKQVRALLECPMSEEEYIAELKEQKLLDD